MNEMQQITEIRVSGVNEVVVYEAPTKFQNNNIFTAFLEVDRRSDNEKSVHIGFKKTWISTICKILTNE